MNNLQNFKNNFQKKNPQVPLHLLSISTMPEHDTPERLKAYAQARKLDLHNWWLATGSAAQVEHLGRLVLQSTGSSAKRDPDEPLFEHTSNLYLFDSQLRLRGIYDADSGKQMQLLAQDLLRL
jgi:cytochrome oxidase Cu insertion factor (SCO1/SenC/PrrC family)